MSMRRMWIRGTAASSGPSPPEDVDMHTCTTGRWMIGAQRGEGEREWALYVQGRGLGAGVHGTSCVVCHRGSGARSVRAVPGGAQSVELEVTGE